MPDNSTGEKIYFRYDGTSMWPFFQRGDLLVVRQVLPEDLRPGDCIVYRKTGGEENIIHRIIAVKPELRTRGDARPVDDEPVAPAWIAGRVEGRIRYGHSTPVPGGVAGVWAGRFYRYAGRLESSRESKGGRIARFIQRFLGQISAPWLRRGRVASFNSADGKLNYLVLGKRTVGVYNEQGQAWSIAWPLCLLIDPGRLPPPR
jgi:signal peptidase I